MPHRIRRFLPLLWCLLFASSLLGCAGPLIQEGPYFGFFPSCDQVEADKARLAIPADLRAKLNAIVVQWNKTTPTERPNPRYVGQTYRDSGQELERKLLAGVLTWAQQEAQAPNPRIVIPPPQQLIPIPPTQWQPSVPVPAADPPLRIAHPVVQFGAGAVAGAAIGAVPLGPMGAEIGIELHLLPKGTYWARVGKACGEIIIGTGQMIVGCAGMTAGTGMSGTGGGAIVGVPVIAGSFALAANGCMTAGHGLAELYQLCREGDPATNVPEVQSAPAPPTLVPKKPATQAAAAGVAPGAKRASSPTVAQQTTSRTVYKDSSGKPIKTVTKTGNTTTTTRNKPAPTQTTVAVNNSANSGTTTVYRAVNPVTKEVQYVGLTGDFGRRQLEHLRERGFQIREVLGGLSRSDARAVEQALIELHGLGKNGGTLLNKINSIAKTNPDFAQLLQKGYDLLKAASYKM